jgi:molybdenum-dependent DNA-binding transcriptional regulator ModE
VFCWGEQSARTAAVDRFNLMSTFERVADTGSFTKAAVSLGISRATVSVAIQQLEDSLGVRLLHRTTRSVSLTPEGRLYLERAREVLSKLDATEQLFRNAQTRVSGRLCHSWPHATTWGQECAMLVVKLGRGPGVPASIDVPWMLR